jgi:site-specific recombinase XerD
MEEDMTPETTTLSRRYADYLLAEGRSKRTIENYRYALEGFSRFLGERSLAGAAAQDIIAYQVDVARRGLSDSSVRVATYALRGFFQKILAREDWNYARLPKPSKPYRLPEVLTPEEVEAILEAAPSPKHAAGFMLCYGAGLRTEEVTHLEPRHIDASRGVIRIERGKGSKDRVVLLPKRLLLLLRECWKKYRPQKYLIEGNRPGRPISPSTIQRAFQIACKAAGIRKRVTPRSFRHAFATHLVENGTRLQVVQALLGHQSLNTTTIYVRLAKNWLGEVKSPLDTLTPKPPAN